MGLKIGGALLLVLSVLALFAALGAWPSSSGSHAAGNATRASSVATAPTGPVQPNVPFSCNQVAPASKAACEANPPNPLYQGGVPAIQPAIQPAAQPGVLSSDVTQVAFSEAAVRSYVSTHITINGTSTPPTISKIELQPVSAVNALIGGGIQGPGNALVYVVRVQGPITLDTSGGPLTGPYEQFIFSAATGNLIAQNLAKG